MRRNPINLLFLIICAFFGLYLFSRSFQYGPKLSNLENNVDPSIMETIKDTQAVNAYDEYKNSHAQGISDDKDSLLASNSQNINDLASGKPIMAMMPNQTIRAEVGRAGWKLLHTILAQYPEKPSQEERSILGTYLKLFSRVYPCQECAFHFQELLKEYPPQLSSRQVAVQWGCYAHNLVNARLNKTEYNCSRIFEEYDCGCGGDGKDTENNKKKLISW